MQMGQATLVNQSNSTKDCAAEASTLHSVTLVIQGKYNAAMYTAA